MGITGVRPLVLALAILVFATGAAASRTPTGHDVAVHRVRDAAVTSAVPTDPEPVAPPAPDPGPWAGIQQTIDVHLGGRTACLVIRRDGRTVVSHNPEAALATASTQKLLVAAAALRVLGPEHKFTTVARSLTPPLDGVVGDLWLVGGGDPMLATPEYAAYLPTNLRFKDHPPTALASLADSLVAAGVRHVQGRVQADDSRHEPVHALPGWKPSFIGEGSVTPLTALTVNGGLSRFAPPRVPMPHPALGAAGELTRLLRERGVRVDNDAGHGVAPPASPELAQVQSAPLVAILSGVLRASDNSATELIVREVGLRTTGAGSTEAGLRAVEASLREAGIGSTGLGLQDGSGLHSGNRASCQVLAETLDSGPAGVDLPGLLAVAGRNGTLWRRFVGTPLEGRLAAKTGWINGVVGLAGRIDRRTTFALIQNDVGSLLEGRAVEEGLLQAIAPLIPS